MIDERELKTECSECSRRKFYQKGYEDCRREMTQEIVENLKKWISALEEESKKPDYECINDSINLAILAFKRSISIVEEVGVSND